MKATNTLSPAGRKEQKSFSSVITGDGAQKLIRASLRNENSVKRFTGTLISVVNASEQLRNCDAGSIISCALRGEGMGLIYGHGYYVVPYGKTATYITGYKGYIQLALATGRYADIDCIEVREGERKGRDPRTGKPIVDMSVYDTDEEREQHPVIGVKAYFLLKDGYYREEYWTKAALLQHAERYSKAFNLSLYNKWQSGVPLEPAEQKTVENGSPWYTSTERMMKKTALRSLLNSGYAPLSNELKSLFDSEPESGEGVIPDIGDEVMPQYDVIETTGEVIEPDEAAEAPETASFEEVTVETEPEKTVPTERHTPRKAKNPPLSEDENVLEGFFE